MVSFFNCVLIIALWFDLVGPFKLRAMGVSHANLGDSYFPFLAYSCFPIKKRLGGQFVHAAGCRSILDSLHVGGVALLIDA